MTGTIEEVGSDMREIQHMGIEHVVFGLFFSPLYENMDQAVEISKQLLQYVK